MQELATTAFSLGVFGYSAAVALFAVDLARHDRLAPAVLWGPRLLALGAVFHLAHVSIVSLLTMTCPVGSVHFVLSVAGVLAVAGYLVLRRRPSLHALGAFVAPTALVLLVASEYVGKGRPAGVVNRGLLSVHVTANLLGFAMFMLAATNAALYLVKERRLREKRVGRGDSKLPPLDVLEATLHRLLLVGFPLLTLGLATGVVVAQQAHHGGAAQVLRAALSYVTWLVVAAVLVFRRLLGWRGRRMAYAAIAGAACMLVVVVLYVVAPSVGAGL